jgi:flagellar hook-associated protein 2
MVTTSSSGGVTTQGSRTFFFGTSSGLNTSALIEAAYAARVAEADKIDIKVTKNTAKNEAYANLQKLGQAVQDSLANLRKNYSLLATDTSTFDKRSGTLSSSNSTDPSKLVTVAIDPGTEMNSYELEIVQKAKAHRIGSDTAGTATAALGYTGTFDLALSGGGAAATINITAGMSLTDIATQINASKATSGVSASVLQVTTGSYQLILSGTQTAKDIVISNVTGTDVMNSVGVTAGGLVKNLLQGSQQAIVELDGVPVTRDNNVIDDLIDGVTLTINNQEPGTFLDLTITADNSALKDDILSFVESYNEFRSFVSTNQTVGSDGSVSEDAVLYRDNYLSGMNLDLQGLLGGIYGSGVKYDNLRSIGITLNPSNELVVDESVLDDAIANEYDEVQSLFQTTTTSSNTEFRMMSNTSRTQSLNVTIDITHSGAAITNASIGGDSSMFTVSGSLITGVAGTAYEGMTFAYVGTTSTSVNFTMEQGFADLVNSNLKSYTDLVLGSIQSEILDINDQNVLLNTRATRVRERADDFRNALIDKYARFEAQISAAKSVLAQLKALTASKSDN